MPAEQFWTDPRVWLYLGLLIPFALCLAFYGLRSPWWTSPVGRALFLLLASMVSVLTFSTVKVSGIIPAPVTEVMRVAFLGSVMVAGWYLFVQIVRLQRDARRGRNTERRHQ